ncbi:cyd operon protein YbgE [Photobacterium sanctipauli]|uniref:Cyd operon protein YbgE n=1 Tax=Photobacterium sanctipauli TaxID=1342794 RepID=A0A2T3NR18_9GAMM|nr:cyd operon protein YbgE [Photobacterium sanctipauli]PSW18695.1 cyd operon protein YbgE [Photobacterium sanctipauli]
MSNLNHWVKRVHQLVDVTLLRLLALVLSLATAGLVIWEPTLFAQAIGGFGPVISPAMIWATCAAMVFGVGFVPRRWYWQVFFTPYLSLPILLYIMWLRLG